jgi:hypothetical protein
MTFNEQLQHAWKLYECEHDHMPASARAAVEWAVEKGLLRLPDMDLFDILADKMSRALRAQTEVDGKGRHSRSNYSIRVSRDGVQLQLWAEGAFASQKHMETHFAQRREAIISDCHKLTIDVDSYNDRHPDRPPYQLQLDFTEDVAERMMMDDDLLDRLDNLDE